MGQPSDHPSREKEELLARAFFIGAQQTQDLPLLKRIARQLGIQEQEALAAVEKYYGYNEATLQLLLKLRATKK